MAGSYAVTLEGTSIASPPSVALCCIVAFQQPLEPHTPLEYRNALYRLLKINIKANENQ